MPSSKPYVESATSLDQVLMSQGVLLLEFGTNWCRHCKAAAEGINKALQTQGHLPHIKEEDGPGKKLGRHFKVKLWPTLILLQDGKELGRVVRPTSQDDVLPLLAKI